MNNKRLGLAWVLGVGLGVLALSPPALAETVVALDDGSAVDARAVVTERLVALGLDAEQARARVDALTEADLQQFAQHPQQLARGGVEDKTLITVAVILIIPSVLLLLLL